VRATVPAEWALFGLTTLFGSWSVLALSKYLEGRELDANLRRIMYFFLGSGIGTAAWLLSQSLFVGLEPGWRVDAEWSHLGSEPLVTALGQPTMLGFATFFGLLFGVRRWWYHCDAYRPARLRFVSVAGTLLVAVILVHVFAFPAGWGLAWAASMSAVVQLAAPWVPASQRELKSAAA